ncbi:MAG: P-II family nitrogen regulator [Thermaurantimonas sp.]
MEIIIPKPDFQRLKQILEDSGIVKYTVLDGVKGHGDRGLRDSLGLSDSFTNIMVIAICDERAAQAVSEPVRKLLSKIGGIAYTSTVYLIQ